MSYCSTSLNIQTPLQHGEMLSPKQSDYDKLLPSSLFATPPVARRPSSDADNHLIEADQLKSQPRVRSQRSRQSSSRHFVATFDGLNPSGNMTVPAARPLISFKEITAYSVKISWSLESIIQTSETDTEAPELLAEGSARFALYMDIPGDNERFRLLYYGSKNRVKITGLRRSTIYRLFIRASLDPRSKDRGTFAAFCTLPEPKLADDGPSNDRRHFKGLLAYANPREKDEAVLAVPSFRCAMWARRYCRPIGELKLDGEYAWQHYRWSAKELGWSEVKRPQFKQILQQNLPELKFNERDFCNIELGEFDATDDDFHVQIKEAQRSAVCWRSADCVPCSIGALHLCQSTSLIYWLSCDLCGSDFIGHTKPHVALSEALNGQHEWIRGHFKDCQQMLSNRIDIEDLATSSSEDVLQCYDYVTGIVIQHVGHDEAVDTMHGLIRHLRPTDNGRYYYE